ncbi:helicase-related protein [Ferrimonas marina]|uniref:DEAD/DEAH box helicase n=1 Tax=Ferrimonas marina TaxID=299255 RepID=A0A1M5XE03_9GAMM|nr:helicase-related protein [Ferrimonas marina]SHH97872.1 DEAD/DEAH box helicase [Ferrimonas marina]
MSHSLPIDPLKPEFLRRLADHHLVVEAETGSGKSTRLPLWAAEQGRVLVVEPRRIASTALADYLSQSHPNVGYAIRFDSTVTEQTQVAFVTPGIALRWFAEDKLAQYQTVIIDEFHERRWDTDLLLALLKRHQQHRLVLTSATVDGERLAQYLEGERLHAEGRRYPVALNYQARDSRDLPSDRDLAQRLKAVIPQALEQTQGDVLVFLPGRKEITQAQQVLEAALSERAEVIPLHASVPKAVQRKALSTGPKPRVILATNVAETSLTIPGVTLVVDSGLERRTHQRNGRTVLGLSRISKASAAQRQGRAGRVAPGQCLRLWGEFAPLEALTPPELQREELVEPMLAAASAGTRLDQLDFVDLLPAKSLGLAAEKLSQMMAIDEQGNITEHGRRLFPLPIDTQFAHLITAMPDKPCQEAMVDLAAALSIGQRLWKLPQSESGLKALNQWVPQACDGLTLVSIVRQTPPEELGIDPALRREARQMASQIRAALGLPELAASSHLPYVQWRQAILSAIPELAFVRRQKRREALGNGAVEVQPGRESRFAEEAEAALVLDQHSLPGRGVRQTLNLATCMMPLTLKELVAAELGEESINPNRKADAGGDEVVLERHYAGRLIGSREAAPEGAQAVEALVSDILKGKRLAPAGQQLQADLWAWRLYLGLGRAQGEAPEAESWLKAKLEDLGVESAEDLELIEPADLAFEGVPEWERAEFDAQFPSNLVLAELKLKVEYHPKAKRVTLVYDSGQRKADPKRWELPSWSGWRIQYRRASRVVDVR